MSCFAAPIMAGEVVAPELAESEKETDSNWSLRLSAGVGTGSSLGQIARGEASLLSETTVYSLELGRTLWTDVGGCPIDISFNIGALYHLSSRGPSDVQQYNVYFKLEWTQFPWNDRLRTRFGIGEGVSWVEEITYSELRRRRGDGSRRFLNYLDFSLSLNTLDLGRLMQLDRIFNNDLQWLDDTWLVANISHRSGAFGAFGDAVGDDGRKRPVTGGDNILTLGITHRF